MSKNISIRDYLFLIASALLLSISLIYVVSELAFICLIPAFIALSNKSWKQTWWLSSIYGCICGTILCNWMLPSITAIVGSPSSKPIIIFTFAILVNIILFNVIFSCIRAIDHCKAHPAIMRSLVIAACWTLIEILHYAIFKTVPFLFTYPALTSLNNEVFIQNAAWIGMHGLSFLVVFINHLFFQAIIFKSNKRLWIGSIISLLLIHALGLCSAFLFNLHKTTLPNVQVAIVNEQHPATLQWNEQTGDTLIQNILKNNKQAQTLKPDIILWSELLVPWTFTEDDDFLRALKQGTSDSTIHLIGMPSYHNNHNIYNSCYFLDQLHGSYKRYDKVNLIPLVEKQIPWMNLPFWGQESIAYLAGNNQQTALHTRKGNIGIMICNETNIWEAAQRMQAGSATFFVAPGSNAWFFNFPAILNQHFYACRLRAIEQRKDIVININKGYSGLINAQGQIVSKYDNESAFVEKVTITPNTYKTFFSHYPNFLLYLIVFIICTHLIYRIYNIVKPKIS